MRTEDFLREATSLPGLSGSEERIARYIEDVFRPLCDEVKTDPLYSVIGHIRGRGPKVMVCAHLDEIGLMVSRIEKDGSLRIRSVGGVDPRILPGMRVTVYGKKTLPGVIGAKVPHLQGPSEKEKNYESDSLYIDLGIPSEAVCDAVSPGDCVTLEGGMVSLLNDRAAGKTMDDRSCVAVMVRAMEMLSRMDFEADLYFTASCQEEVGGYGAMTAGYGIDPDFGVVLDVSHARTPGAPELETFDLDSPSIAMGPFIHPYLRRRLAETAKRINVKIQDEIVPGFTSTDADDLSLVRSGVPSVLISLPVRYMHTTVETLDLRALEETARLLAAYLADISSTWRDELWT